MYVVHLHRLHRLTHHSKGLGSIVVFFATVFALLANVSNGLAAIVIVQSAVFAEASRQLVRVLAQVELDFNSVERIVEYFEVPQEKPLIADRRPPAYWPSTEGQVHVENLVVKYSDNLPPALDHVSFTVRPREKIGVVSVHHDNYLTISNIELRRWDAQDPVRCLCCTGNQSSNPRLLFREIDARVVASTNGGSYRGQNNVCTHVLRTGS